MCTKGLIELRPGPNHDEIKQFIDGRWICAPEAFWRIFGFYMNQVYPSVHRLQLHLPNRQQVFFYDHQSIAEVLADERNAIAEEDDSIRQCMVEARATKMLSALRRLFVTILVYCHPNGVRRLWNENFSYVVEDYPTSSNVNSLLIQNKLLHDINVLLSQHKRSISDYDLPKITEGYEDVHTLSSIIEEELSIAIPDQDLHSISVLNSDQQKTFDIITEAIRRKQSAIFFIDGPGGTGKTFLYRALLASLRKEGHIMIAVATSGIASMLLPGGRTAHSKLKIPIPIVSGSRCYIHKETDLAELIRQTTAIIWDEASMADRKAFEVVDKTFRDITGAHSPFGGKIMILGGDFRQVLPVILKGTRAQIVAASIVRSYLWENVRILRLQQNMRAQQDQAFGDFLLRVGNGDEHGDDMIKLSGSMVIPWEGEKSIDRLIDVTFPELHAHGYDTAYMVQRALLTPLNEDVNKLNERVVESFPGEEHIYYSFDSVQDDHRNLYSQEFLNSISPGNLPPHKLILKKGVPIMLLRNIDPKIGLCNGTRWLCCGFGRNFIDAEILTRQFSGTRVFLPRIPMKTAEDISLPFELTRKQFPVRLSFALTINKSHGQTIQEVGIYLPEHVFTHGQIYVALSRGTSGKKTKVLLKKGELSGKEGVYTKNVVFKELFTQIHANS